MTTMTKGRTLHRWTCTFCGTSYDQYADESDREFMECASCGGSRDWSVREIAEPEVNDMVDVWTKMARSNPWIATAYDPPLSRSSFYCVESDEELVAKFLHGNWCVGTAFYTKDHLCFINQVNGGSEFLVIRGHLKFESISADRMCANDSMWDWLDRVRKASDHQLAKLRY